jgi:hypothetical protein
MSKSKQEWVSFPINEYRTPRRCAYCPLPARREDYRQSLDGSVDKSSRRFTCGNEHPDGVIV